MDSSFFGLRSILRKTPRLLPPSFLVRLEEEGMVHRHSHGTYRFSPPMLREYLHRRAGGAELA